MAATGLLAGDPSRLGDYWPAGRLGAGGQGVVYEAYDSEGTRVAVKVLHADAAADPDLRSRFGKEATAAQRVASFCTARILAVDLEAPKPYIVSEYIEGPSLRTAVTGGRLFAGDDLYRLATAVATALTAIHDAGVIHRDLKPDNVLLGPDGPRVIDFGIAHTLEMSLTATGMVTGTPTYMAPEVFTGQRAGAPADVFSWGAIVVYAANGDDPFRAESLGAVMHKVLATDPELDYVPRTLRPLVAAALSKDPLARPTARELLLGLITGFQGTQAELLTMGSVEAGLLAPGGRADPALGTLAEDAYGFLNPAQRDLVPDLFLRLIGFGEADEIKMRTASRDELLGGRTPEEQAAFDRVLDVFSYLLTTRGDAIGIARPALVQAWPRLRSWVDDEREGLPVHAAIHAAAVHWDDHGRREADVYQGSRLETALRWAATGRRHLTLTELERDFLDACNAATRHRVRRRRLLTVTLATLLVLALVAGTLAVLQTRTVTAQREMLAARLAEASAGKAATEADAMRTTDPVRAMLLSVAAWRLSPTPATRSTLQNAWAQHERTAFTDPDNGGETLRQLTLDGRRLFSVSRKGVRIWDVRTGKRVGGWDDVKIGEQTFRGIALSDSGKRLAVVAGGTIQVWDTTTGRVVARHKLWAQQHFHSIDFGLNDRWLTVHEGQGAELWDTSTGKTVGYKNAPIVDAAYTPAGDLAALTLLTGDGGYQFGLLRLPSGHRVAHWHDSDTCAGTAKAVAFSPDGHTLACGDDSKVTVLDVRTGRPLPYEQIVAWKADGPLRFSPDGRLLWAGSRLVRVADGRPLLTYGGAKEGVGFDGTSLRFLTGETVVGIDVSDVVSPVRLPVPASQATTFSPDGRLLLTHAENASSMVLWDTARRRPLGAPIPVSGDDPFGPASGPVFSGDGRFLAYAGDENMERVRVWDTVKQARVAEIKLPADWTIYSLALNGDGSLLAVGARGMASDYEEGRDKLLVWDVRRGRWSRSIDFKNDVSVVFRPGTPQVALTEGGSNRLLDLSTGREIGPPLGPGRVSDPLLSLDFSPDGGTVAISSSGGVAFWDVRSGARRGPSLNIAAGDIMFSPKGDVAAVVYGDEAQVQLVDVSTPRRLGPPLRLEGTDMPVVTFAAGGAVLRAVDQAGVIHEMPVDPARTAAAVCARAGRTLTLAEWRQYFPGVEPYRDPCK
ncbi:WD40 repeat domain-containing serine/threonine-protein kinase [Sphaerisporangium fuscum]|uniref:WD40 repeat domain-containing serine/threonine-protein kinase n=1 Tax=Sphaerisporangium fuscum TaxID=2835868 RepID=UPI001BDDB7B7|nr:WD40 repeat domain-containing serine/threonine protein kinase [Sphaerisporangium fuscum]